MISFKCDTCGRLYGISQTHICKPETVTNNRRLITKRNGAMTGAQRAAKWRIANRELANARSRDCMRRKRERATA